MRSFTQEDYLPKGPSSSALIRQFAEQKWTEVSSQRGRIGKAGFLNAMERINNQLVTYFVISVRAQ
jgi:hypothetical protein